jgi:hypothetical protein
MVEAMTEVTLTFLGREIQAPTMEQLNLLLAAGLWVVAIQIPQLLRQQPQPLSSMYQTQAMRLVGSWIDSAIQFIPVTRVDPLSMEA